MSNAVRIELPATQTGPTAPTPPEKKTETQPAETPQRPEWCPEKFWKDGKVDEQGLAKSYSELEKSASKPKETQPEGKEPKPGEQPDETPQQKTEKAFKPFFDEFAEKGELSEDSFKALEAQGFDRRLVEQYIAGSKALQAASTAEIFETTGGQENYQKMIEWARTGLSADEIAAFNNAVSAGRPLAEVKLAVAGLHAKYTAAEGSPAALIRGTGSAAAVAPFRSMAEMTEAMKDPRYAKDSAFRQEVADRLANSKL